MFQFAPLASVSLCIQEQMTRSTLAGFPHSGILGSLPACGSPRLFAAYHALLRRSVPRHPPCAPKRLTGSAVDPGPPRPCAPSPETTTPPPQKT